MASLALAFDILARDRASDKFEKVGRSAERAGRAGDGFGKTISKSALLAGGALVGLGAAAVQGFRSVMSEARESQKVGALTTQVIKSTGGAAKVTAAQVGDLATAISNKTGIDDEAIQSASNLLLTFTNVRNEVGKGNDIFNQATQAATDMGAALGGDPKTSAIQLGKALNDPVKGITALSKVGVSFTAQQKDQVKAMVKSGDVLGAQKLILGELNKEFGGAAAASATAGEKLKTAFGNFKEGIGTALLPVVDKVANGLRTRLLPGIQGVVDILFKGDFTKGFREAFKLEEDSKFVGFLFGVRDAFKELVGGVKAFGAAWKANDGDVTSSGFAGFMEKAANAGHKLFDYLKDAVPPIIESAKKLWPPIKEIATQLFAASTAGGASTFGLLKAAIAALPGILRTVAPLLQSVAKWMGENKEIVAALVVALGSGIAAFRVISGVVKAFTVVQGLLNVVLAANPIGLVVVAIAALVAGLVYAYKNSETFRDIVNGAFDLVKKGAIALALVAVKSFHFLLDVWLTVAGGILDGAAFAFGWVPGLGPKLQTAAANFRTFKDSVNKTLDKVETDLTVQLNTGPAKKKADELAKYVRTRNYVAVVKTTVQAGNVNPKLLLPLAHNARGTSSWRGGPTWVGEEGPEIVDVPRGARIYDAQKSAAMTAGGSSGSTYSRLHPHDIALLADAIAGHRQSAVVARPQLMREFGDGGRG